MFRRPRRALPPRFVIDDRIPAEVARANQLMAAGQPEPAALMYIQLAGQMQIAGHPRQAANLHAQAAHAWLDAGIQTRALNQYTVATRMFTDLGMLQRAEEFRANFNRHMRDRGMMPSSIMEDSVKTSMPEYQLTSVIRKPDRGTLPAACPHCGAPVRSDTIDWIDDLSAECDFCSGTIKTVEK